MLCSTMRMVVWSLSLISAILWNTSVTMMGASPSVGSSSRSSSGAAMSPRPKCQHLLLPAGHLAGHVAALLAEDRKEIHDRFQPALFLRSIVEVQTAHIEVLFDGQVGEHPPALGHECNAFLDNLVGGRRQRALAPVDASADHGGQSHDSLEDGGLSGPVGAHHRHDFALLHSHRHLVQGHYGPVTHRHVDKL